MTRRPLHIAFYAPLKSPDHPVPSGDRLMARQLLACLRAAGHRVDVVSHLRAYLGRSDDTAGWRALQAEAGQERARIAADWRTGAPDLWVCYHPYVKSPDLLGPDLCRAFGLPFITIEASWSARRNLGIWVDTQAAALAAVTGAALNLCLTARDRTGLAQAAPAARLSRLPPFIDTTPFDATPAPEPGHIVTVAMMRAGDKTHSFALMAKALARLPADLDWRLSVAGDGPERDTVQALFAHLPPARIAWLGALPRAGVADLLARGQVYLWPGCGEAYGLAYLEAQAAGLPVVACDTAGVPEVVSAEAGNRLVPLDAQALADAVTGMLRDRSARGATARAHVRRHHSIGAATTRLAAAIDSVMAERSTARGRA